MAQQIYRANVLPSGFPFISEQFGRTVIVGQIDQIKSRALGDGEADMLAHSGQPQLYYCHNVMPTEQGLQSVGYSQLVAPLAPTETAFVDVLALRDSLDRTAYLGYTSDGRFYTSQAPFTSWTYETTIAGAAGKVVTKAYAQGYTYIYIANVGCYVFDFVAATLTPVTLGGLVPSVLLGVTSLNGYLITWTAYTIAWSAIANPIDFVPSLSTGAGSASVEGAAGAILLVTPANGGLLVYTTGNVVAASYTNNSQYPFSFKPLGSTGGLKDVKHCDKDSLSDEQFAYTTSGMQQLTIQLAKSTIPQFTDFLAGSEFEDCDVTSGTLTKTVLSTPLVKSVKLVANRYLVVSYGMGTYTHALVYDTLLKRFGKLRIAHTACIDLNLGQAGTNIPRKSLGFLQIDGTILVANFDSYAPAPDSIAILGKYQFMRTRTLQLDSIEFENIQATDAFALRILSSDDGKNVTMSTPVLKVTDGLYRKYTMRTVGVNHSLILSGTYSLNTLVIAFNVHGRR